MLMDPPPLQPQHVKRICIWTLNIKMVLDVDAARISGRWV